jgi:hypothetical protein
MYEFLDFNKLTPEEKATYARMRDSIIMRGEKHLLPFVPMPDGQNLTPEQVKLVDTQKGKLLAEIVNTKGMTKIRDETDIKLKRTNERALSFRGRLLAIESVMIDDSLHSLSIYTIKRKRRYAIAYGITPLKGRATNEAKAFDTQAELATDLDSGHYPPALVESVREQTWFLH